MQILKADTVTEVLIGPVVAVGDGFTPVTSLTIAGADEAEIIKHGATTVTAITGTLAAITSADGYYALDLVTGDVDTEGRLTILINDDSLCLPVRHDFMVVNANVFDSLFAAATTDYLQVDTTQWLGTACATPTTNGVPEVDVTHVAGTAQTAGDIIADTNDLQTQIGTAGAGLTALVDLVWDEVLTGATHNVTNSAGKLLRLISAITTVDGTVNDAAATTTYFISDLTNAVTDFYKDSIIIFTSGVLAGQARPITAYNGTTKRITIDEAWTSAPANTVAFTILSTHVHPVTQISAAVWDEAKADHTGSTTFGDLATDLDTVAVDVAGLDGAAMRGTDNAALASVCTETRLSELDAATGGKMANQVDVIETDTTANLDAAISTRATPAQVNTEVLDVLNTDTFAEPGQEIPGATVSLVKKISYLYKAWRNKLTQDATTYKLYADDATTIDQKAIVSDDATTFTKGEIGTGP